MTQNKTKGTSGSLNEQDLGELRKRIEWLDEERRTSLRKLAELEQRVVLQERELSTRDKRISDLEKQLAQTSNQLSRIPMVDTQLAQFRDDIVKMIEQYDKRRIEADREIDRLRRVEHEAMTREIADIRKEVQVINRIEEAVSLRQAEESRLAALIGSQQNTLTQLASQVDGLERAQMFLDEKEKQDNRNISEMQATLLEISKRWEPLNNKLEIINQNLLKAQTAAQANSEAQSILRKSINDWTEQVQIGEHERNQRLISWQRAMDEHEAALERFTQDWVKFNNQYNESRAAIETIRNFQVHLEQLQREANELIRVESQRLESRWVQFVDEDNRKWKNYEADATQRQSISDRREREFREQLQGLEEQMDSLQQDIAQLLRIQTAQSEAIKKWPLMWLDEVEKAVEQNPNRRRQPTLVQIREE